MAAITDNGIWRPVRYSDDDRVRWDEFAGRSRNATFLFLRGYMDYHRNRFSDCSWMVYKGERLMAMLPANLTPDGVLHSHQGLTYGGWILPQRHLDGADLLAIMETCVAVWRREGIRALDYKPLPYIYADRPSQEDIYALNYLGARVSGVNLSETIDLHVGPDLNTLQRRHLRKAPAIEVRAEENVAGMMALVGRCLSERYGATPVHSAAEMQTLCDRFGDNIKFYSATICGETEPQAVVCLYLTGRVAHCQYIATTPRARELNLLTPLMAHLMQMQQAEGRLFFDFGTSNENDGSLNTGLLRQKASYGASGVAYMRYLLEL